MSVRIGSGKPNSPDGDEETTAVLKASVLKMTAFYRRKGDFIMLPGLPFLNVKPRKILYIHGFRVTHLKIGQTTRAQSIRVETLRTRLGNEQVTWSNITSGFTARSRFKRKTIERKVGWRSVGSQEVKEVHFFRGPRQPIRDENNPNHFIDSFIQVKIIQN